MAQWGVPALVLPEPERHERQSAQSVALALVEVVDLAAAALNGLTEATLVSSLEVACRGLAATLGVLAASLPDTPDRCEQALQVLQAAQSSAVRHLTEGAALLHEQDRYLLVMGPAVPPTISGQEALQVMSVVRAVLSDVRSELLEVSREELEELAAVGLAVARMAISTAQTAAQRMKADVDRDTAQTVVIEDVSEGPRETWGWGTASLSSESGRRAEARPSPPRRPDSGRYLWPPLWPALKAWASDPVLPVPDTVREHPVLTVTALGVTWPLWLTAGIVSGWSLILMLPWVLAWDAGLQAFYSWQQHSIDEFLDGTIQVVKLWYLTTRLTVRRSVRFTRAQVRRAMAGRTIWEVSVQSFRTPVSSTWASTVLLWRAGREAVRLLVAACSQIPPPAWSRDVSALWSRLRGRP